MSEPSFIKKLGSSRTVATPAWISPCELHINATCCSLLSELTNVFTFLAPKVCEACKNKNEDDNDIMETLCKNDFGKSSTTKKEMLHLEKVYSLVQLKDKLH